MPEEPVLLLGVGATKSGTTWLYTYLARHGDCRFRSVKELHYFDGLDDGSQARQISVLKRGIAAAEATRAKTLRPLLRRRLGARIADHAEMIAVHEAPSEAEGLPRYLNYLLAPAKGRKVVGDITPAYALLSEERLAMMARLTKRTRVVYIMRDPVDRLWSHVRMKVRKSAPDASDPKAQADRILHGALTEGKFPDLTSRGDYVAALTKLRSAVPPDHLHVDFYERLISEKGVGRLCKFLGIGYRAPMADDRVHAGLKIRLDTDQRRAAARALARQYDFVERTVGPLPQRWQAQRELAGMERV